VSLKFTKMHGLGNDYVYVSLFDQTVADPPRLAKVISDRHRGVGGDGLILVAPPENTTAHVRMIMFNADGSRAQMCGNGIRCVAKLAYERGLARANPLQVETDRGVLSLMLTLDAADRVTAVRVDLGEPILDPRRIPVALGGERVVAAPMPFREQVLSVTCVSLGNPHAVFFERHLASVPLAQWGPQLERHPLFPERINVHFVQVLRRDRVKMITWERGTGLTQACGSGAAAVCVAGVLNRLTERALTALLPGGELQLEWEEASNHVFMTGPATEVFTGQWPA
jgi:diaminopimelate epimerase